MEVPRIRRRAVLTRIAITAALSLLAAISPSTLTGQTNVTAFQNVTVIPMDTEQVLEGQTVVVRDGRIAEVGDAASITVPEGATVVDGSGKFLLPGLAELHAHIPTPQGGAEAVEQTLFLYLAGGVTTIRGMLGHPSHLELREQSARNEIIAPRIYTSGPSFSGGNTNDPAEAANRVREQHAAGYDLVKMHPGVSREAFDAIMAAADELDFPVAGHVPAAVALNHALEVEMASIDHLDGYVEALAGYGDGFEGVNVGLFGFGVVDEADESRIPELARATREADVWNVPTQTLLASLASAVPPEEMANWPEMRYVSPQTLDSWVQRKRDFQAADGFTADRAARYMEIRRQIIKALHDEGAPLALGSDAPQWWNVPGFSARRELELMVEAGLTPFEALATGTREAARYFDDEEEWGTIAPGLAADLLLFDANPLEDIGNIWEQSGVMIRGRWISGEEVERRLDEIATQVGN